MRVLFEAGCPENFHLFQCALAKITQSLYRQHGVAFYQYGLIEVLKARHTDLDCLPGALII